MGGNSFYEFHIPIQPPHRELLTLHLDKLGFNGFLEDDDGIKAYIDSQLFSGNFWKLLSEQFSIACDQVKFKEIPHRNWNQEWESYFKPQIIDDKVRISAPFHTVEGEYPYEIIIEPQMAFGTGYHATTRMMVKLMLKIPSIPAKVFDFGTGSGVLAILAEKIGANHTFANEVQDDGLRNAYRNVYLNNCQAISLSQEDIYHFPSQGVSFDLILANINRNTIIGGLPILKELLVTGGQMLVSGFYAKEAHQVEEQFNQYGFELVEHLEESNWAAGFYQLKRPLL